MIKIERCAVITWVVRNMIALLQFLQETPFIDVIEWILMELPHKQEGLTKAEQGVYDDFVSAILSMSGKQIPLQCTVWAMIGLTGHGTTYVAKQIASEHGAVYVSSNDVRVALARVGCSYRSVGEIVRRLVQYVLNLGHSVVIDSNHVDPRKRAWLRRYLRGSDIELRFVCVHAREDQALLWISGGPHTDTIYDPLVCNSSSSPSALTLSGSELQLAERNRHRSWFHSPNGKVRKFAFRHSKIWNDVG